ncbi:tyrosine-type recombinase/integrase [Pirellulales bacterium]|nr:tyrosine-type recombinase/integrase [Pirellulales bacterium]
MHETIKVHIVKYKGRKNLMMRYLDPFTGKQIARSTGTADEKEAPKVAAVWQDKLRNGRYRKPSRWTWQEFRDHHREHILDGMKTTTAGSYDATLNVFERAANPQRLADITTARVTAFATTMREQGRSPATVARHLKHLQVILRWAQRQGLLHELPRFDIPKYRKSMKGRPITLEEFERMLAAVPGVLTSCKDEDLLTSDQAAIVDSWRFYLRGLWESGLRLEESLTLRWDDSPAAIVVDLEGRRPMLRISAEAEKGGRDRVLPMTPEFAALLEGVPESQRKGRVFRLLGKSGGPLKACRRNAGVFVSKIGSAAGVVVNRREKKGELVPVYASAHDLRRSFGFRWSRRVMPTILRELMRHESIETTMRYYVGQNAEATADELWRAVGNTSGNNRDSDQNAEAPEESENR